MPRKPSSTLTEAESRIMDVLWQQGEASVSDVVDGISNETKQAYNTIQTILGILKDKGIVKMRKEGRAFLYQPLMSRGEARARALRQLISNTFGGSPSTLAQYLLKDSDIDDGEISTLEQVIKIAIENKDNKND